MHGISFLATKRIYKNSFQLQNWIIIKKRFWKFPMDVSEMEGWLCYPDTSFSKG